MNEMARSKPAFYVIRPEDVPPAAVLPIWGISEADLPPRLRGKL